MSATELHRHVVNTLNDMRDRAVEYSLNTTFRPSSFGDRYVPATTPEEIAMQVIHGNAMARAFTQAIEVVNEAYRLMYQPDSPIDRQQPEQRKEMY